MAEQQTPPEDGEEETPAEGEENEGGEQPTLEEVIAERDALQARLDRNRTAKAREARAKNRQKDKPAGDGGEDGPTEGELAQKARADALEARLNSEQAQRVAAELGFKSPSLAPKLIDFNELTDPSDADEVRDALRDVLKASPELKKASGKADGGEGGGTGGTTPRRSFNDIIRAAAGR